MLEADDAVCPLYFRLPSLYPAQFSLWLSLHNRIYRAASSALSWLLREASLGISGHLFWIIHVKRMMIILALILSFIQAPVHSTYNFVLKYFEKKIHEEFQGVDKVEDMMKSLSNM